MSTTDAAPTLPVYPGCVGMTSGLDSYLAEIKGFPPRSNSGLGLVVRIQRSLGPEIRFLAQHNLTHPIL